MPVEKQVVSEVLLPFDVEDVGTERDKELNRRTVEQHHPSCTQRRLRVSSDPAGRSLRFLLDR